MKIVFHAADSQPFTAAKSCVLITPVNEVAGLTYGQLTDNDVPTILFAARVDISKIKDHETAFYGVTKVELAPVPSWIRHIYFNPRPRDPN